MRFTCIANVIFTRVSFVTDGGCLACRNDLTDELRTQTDTRPLELWAQEDIVFDPNNIATADNVILIIAGS